MSVPLLQRRRFNCCDLRRLNVLRAGAPGVNAIEFIEVLDLAAPPGAPRQQTLFLRLLRPAPALMPEQISIEGGERIARVGILWCAPANALPAQAEPGLVAGLDELARTLVIRSEGHGDFSTYTLRLRANSGSTQPPAGFDPRLSSIEFSFKVECPSEFDCLQHCDCPPEPQPAPVIDYLAKDYTGFRRLMLDRLSLLAPGWTERSAADLGLTLVELLAYAADQLSYRQDVIATEAYLATARQRISVRRHARLVDYALHEGCNARVFVQLQVSGQSLVLPAHSQLLSRCPELPTEIAPASPALRQALASGALVFETQAPARLDERLNELHFYSWGERACCLPRGTTRASLRGHHAELQAGDLLLLEEVLSPSTFTEQDRDPAHRWVLRLTRVTLGQDPSGQLFDEPPVNAALDLTEIEWAAADALPFPLCLSVAERPELRISVARGNVVLADHGQSLAAEDLGSMPAARLQIARSAADCGCASADNSGPNWIAPRFRPKLSQPALSHGFDLSGSSGPASGLLLQDPRAALPQIHLLSSIPSGPPAAQEDWWPRQDLLSSAADDRHFVVEVDDAGRAQLRFGDDAHGRRPSEGMSFAAHYRVGNGQAGNVGAEAIAHIVSASSGVFLSLRNPLAAAGGVEPEDLDAARRDAPQAFRRQERAVTAADYAAAAERLPEVQRAAAVFRWTGSWHTVQISADRLGHNGETAQDAAAFGLRLRRHLERFRMAGYDLALREPRYVALDIALHICCKPGYFRADVKQAVQQALSSDVLADGGLGAFHPDRFSFGDSVYLSRVIAAAQAVEGVASVRAERFQRLVQPSSTSLAEGQLPMAALEIAQLANKANFRERGRLVLNVGGGQ
ncbi:putative baseplate assembly protein [Paucibacter sp. KBW04]|uniref:putative baseplate assembly protein n=1 Tax=Paucibacter sp. KBW04 TaxID=2153361 RepID=UPI000F5609A4|nr:putative baseplate assembly protein [Paucibacter sp. KBW04]RQO54778.1 putative baseplate assembly protein [Paucibacter sp. KBW04]